MVWFVKLPNCLNFLNKKKITEITKFYIADRVNMTVLKSVDTFSPTLMLQICVLSVLLLVASKYTDIASLELYCSVW